MSARDLLPIATATLIRDYLVSITFEDGQFEAAVKTTSARQAYHMALTDARMLSSSGTFFGKLQGYTVDLIEMEPMQV